MADDIGSTVRARIPNEPMAFRKPSGVRMENGRSEALSPVPMAGRSRGLDPSQERGLAVQRDAFRRGATWPPLMPYKNAVQGRKPMNSTLKQFRLLRYAGPHWSGL